jgi:hypothetical protein
MSAAGRRAGLERPANDVASVSLQVEARASK